MKALLFAVGLATVGCQKPAEPSAAPPPRPPPAAKATPRADKPATPSPHVEVLKAVEPPSPAVPIEPESVEAVTLQVVAAPVVANALKELARVYGGRPGGGAVEVESGELYDALKQLGTSGGDLLVTEGWAALEVARAAGILAADAGRTVTHLELAVTLSGAMAGEAKALADLDRRGVKVGIPDPSSTSGGQAARRLMARASLQRRFQERTLPMGADTALKDGTVDAWIGWGKVKGAGVPLALPAGLGELMPIPAAVTVLSKHPREAARFLEFLASDDAVEVWRAAGTTPRPAADACTIATVLPGKLPAPRRSAGVAVVGRRVLLIGGEGGGTLLDTLTWYDPATLLSEDAAVRLPHALQGAVVGWSEARKEVAVAGGLTESAPLDEILTWNASDGAVETLDVKLPLPMGGAGGLLAGDRLFVVGGRTSGGALTDAIVRVDLAARTATRLAAGLPSPRASVGVAPGADGRLLVAGGDGEQGPIDELLRIDPASEKVEILVTHLDRALSGPSVVPWHDGWLIVGGRAPKGTTDTVVYLGKDDRLTTQSTRLPWPLEEAAAVRLGEAIWVLGGLAPDRVEGRIARLPQ